MKYAALTIRQPCTAVIGLRQGIRQELQQKVENDKEKAAEQDAPSAGTKLPQETPVDK
jgi:hypothetical protein